MPQVDTLPDVALDPALAGQIATESERARTATPVTAERDRLIRQAYADGAGVREIGRAAGLTHRAVTKIVSRA